MRTTSPPITFGQRPLAYATSVVGDRVPRALRHSGKARVLRTIGRTALNGAAVTCPVCSTDAARFVKGMCANCASGPRPRLLALFLDREMQIGTEGGRILHFAPEPGLHDLLARTAAVDYVPVDLRPPKGWQQADATNLTLAPDFDGVITSHVLEHVPDDRRAMAEMYRVLKPGGWALVIVPVVLELTDTFEGTDLASSWARHRLMGQHDHVRIYGLDVSDRLREAGFEVTDRRYHDELDDRERARYGLHPRDVIHVCRKPH